MYAQLQGRPTYFIAYDSLTETSPRHGPTDTPLPATPREEHIATRGVPVANDGAAAKQPSLPERAERAS
jgi:dolichol-phosphate mannosyltransferase